MGYQYFKSIVYVLQVSTTIPITLCTMNLFVSQHIEMVIVPDKILCRSRLWDINCMRSLYKLQVSKMRPWHNCTSLFPNGHNCSFFHMIIRARPGCGRYLSRGFGQYCISKQPDLDKSALYNPLFTNGQKCGFCYTRIRVRQGCWISIARKDSVYIASLNNYTLTPLHFAPLSLPNDRSVLCARQEFTVFGRYCKSQQTALDTSSICASLFTKGHNCGLFQTGICARPGRGR